MSAARSAAAPLVLVWGADDYAVQQRARQLFAEWTQSTPGADAEILDARANNAAEALRALARLREALQTLPFFGSTKLVWFRDCNFLGDDRTADAKAVSDSLAALAQEWKRFDWRGVRLLISAPTEVDRRRALYKTLEALGQVEEFPALDAGGSDWAERAEEFVQQEAAARGQRLEAEAAARLIAAVGPHRRQLASELEKASLHAAGRPTITVADVEAVVVGSKQARAFALAEALGDRDLPAVLRALDEELWELRHKVGRDKSAIGLLYGLVSKVRLLLLLKELVRLGHLKAGASPNQVRTDLARLPAGLLPAERRYNPAALHPYAVSKALAQVQRYTPAELVQALETLLISNQRLVGSSLDEALVLQQALVQIIGPAGRPKPAASSPRPSRAAARA